MQETGLRPELLSALADIGFEQPTPIQEKIIPLLLEEQTRDQSQVALARCRTNTKNGAENRNTAQH